MQKKTIRNRMLVALLFSFLLSPLASYASDIFISISQLNTDITYAYSIHCNGLIASIAKQAFPREGIALEPTHSFKINHHQLVKSKLALTKADHILFEGSQGKSDVVVIKREHYSYSSLKKLLSALTGHPVPVSKIALLLIKGNKIVVDKTLISEESPYEWSVKALATSGEDCR